MSMLTRKVAILAAIESTYNDDALPDAANAILTAGEPTVTPMDMQTVDREILRSFFGNSEKMPTGIFSRVEFKVEVAGSGTAGTAPAWGALLRACAFAETVTVGTKVDYAPVTDSLESASIYINRDGVLHKLTGARGSVKIDLGVDALPYFNFSFLGLFNQVADAAMPAANFLAWKKPLVVNRTNTPTFTLHGYAAKAKSLQIDMAGDLTHKAFLNDTESILMTGRKPAGSIVMEATKVADKDWWTAVSDVAAGALNVIHGLTAGNKVQIAAPNVQIHSPSYSEEKGILMLNANLVLSPNTGNDEILITAL